MKMTEVIYKDWTILLEGHTGKRRASIYKGEFFDEECHYKYNFMVFLEQYNMSPEFENEILTMTKTKAKKIVNNFLYKEYWGSPSKYEN